MCAAASLVALLLAEGALRVYFPEVGKLRQLVVSTADDRGYAPKPSFRISFDGVFAPLSRGVIWQTNAEGLRDDRDVGPTTERFRVATYGDSETFGWSVALEDTFQRRMEAIDPRVEVLNFGVPGYNVTNIRDQIERTLPRFRPDLVIYLVNKNDTNEPVAFTPLSHSHVLLHLRFLWHFTVAQRARHVTRHSERRREVFGGEVDRMTRFLDSRDTPFVLGFLKWTNREAVPEYHPQPTPFDSSAFREHAARRFRREFVDVKAVVRGEPKEDGHMAVSAHRKMAALFCSRISRAAAGACIPPGWVRVAGDGVAGVVTAVR
jgi:hypothetical protein